MYNTYDQCFYYYTPDELYHYGVLGMKWGVRRSIKKANKNYKLERKAYKMDKKAAALTKKSEKIHAKVDLGRSNRQAVKAAKYRKKAAKIMRRSLAKEDPYKIAKMERKVSKLLYKATKKEMKGNTISKSTGYGKRAMLYAYRADKKARKAAKLRYKMGNNNLYTEKLNRKYNKMDNDQAAKVKEYAENRIQKKRRKHVNYDRILAN